MPFVKRGLNPQLVIVVKKLLCLSFYSRYEIREQIFHNQPFTLRISADKNKNVM